MSWDDGDYEDYLYELGEFAEQWNIPCIVLEGTENGPEVIDKALESEATYDDGEDLLLCVQFPGRPMELYTHVALTFSLPDPPQADGSGDANGS